MRKESKISLFRLFFLVFLVAFYYISNYYFENPQEEFQNIELRETSPTINETENNSQEEELKIYFVDVGQADCILISYNGLYTLIDAGNNADGKKLVTYFQSLGIKEFQYIIGTHAHEDHIGGLDDIIKSFSINHFFMPDVITTTKTFEDVLDALEEKQIAFETPSINSTFTMGNTKFLVLWVSQDKDNLNDTSIVLKMIYKNTTYLFTGDASSTVEKKILSQDLESDLLKVGHHGSQYSTSAQFLKKVNPKYAVIQVGKNNEYNHPRQVVLDKLNYIGTKVYRTDLDGTIIVTSDGENINIDTISTNTNG